MSAAAQRSSVPFTVEQLFALPGDDERYEIHDGELTMVPSPDLGHQDISKELQYQLMHYLKQHPVGVVFNASVAFVINQRNYTEPDLIYVANEHRSNLRQRGIEGSADLVVEILSPSTRKRDLGIKKAIYEQAGVRHYWVIDGAGRSLCAFQLAAGRYDAGTEHGPNATSELQLFPGLRIDLASLWCDFP